MSTLSAYRIDNIDNADTPFLAVYAHIVKSNIRRLISLFGSKDQIRPHVKTHKCPQVVKLLLDAGINKFKCSTIAEAEMLAIAGAVNVLLAYQPVGHKITRLLNLVKAYPECLFSCLIDNEITAEQLSQAALQRNTSLNVWIDLNVGMNRTGIAPGEEAKALFVFCTGLKGLAVVGLHAYDGHLTDPDSQKRLADAQEGFTKVKDLVNELVLAGFDAPGIVAGSTPTIPFYASQPDVECSPGTFIYWDQHYQHLFPELGFENAALVVTRVISNPHPSVVCLDLGYKAISSEGSVEERVDFPDVQEAKILSQSEEHLLISTGPLQPRIGDAVFGLPYHIGRTCNLYESCAVIEGYEINTHWDHTARLRQINI